MMRIIAPQASAQDLTSKLNELIIRIVNTRKAVAHTRKNTGNASYIELVLIGNVIEFTLKNFIFNFEVTIAIPHIY